MLIPTPSDSLPEICDEYNLVPQQYKTQLDAGSAMFELRIVKRRQGQSEQDLLQVIKDKYPNHAARLVAELRRTYQKTGVWVGVT